jgi:lipopolysaccharide biosynthesis glycosyltransferase
MNQAELSVFKRIGLTLPEKAQLEKDLEKMWAPFEQMDREYVEIVRTFHQKFLNPNFTQQYKNELRATAKNDIKELQRKYVAQAKETLAKIREGLLPKVEKVQKTDTARLADITLWSNTLPHASANELRDLWVKHNGDEDFMALLYTEFKKRKDDPMIQKMKHEIENVPLAQEVQDLDKLQHTLNLYASSDMYPAFVYTQRPEFRSVDRDLNSVPVDDGATWRPDFDLKRVK